MILFRCLAIKSQYIFMQVSKKYVFQLVDMIHNMNKTLKLYFSFCIKPRLGSYNPSDLFINHNSLFRIPPPSVASCPTDFD